ncbi:MarR family winged helix-turn-helix transcriptional regulator [Algoriphagus namhaensis]
MNPTDHLSFNLYSCSRLLIQLVQSTLSDFGLTYPQYLVLSILWDKDGLRVSQIGDKIYLDSGTLTPLLKKLEAQNYIKRVRGEEDERTVTAELTYPGKSLQSRVEEAMDKLDEKLQEISGENLRQVNQSIPGLLEELLTIKNQ